MLLALPVLVLAIGVVFYFLPFVPDTVSVVIAIFHYLPCHKFAEQIEEKEQLLPSADYPSISVVIPCKNEAEEILATIDVLFDRADNKGRIPFNSTRIQCLTSYRIH